VRRPRAARPNVQRSAFAGFRFPPEVITVAVRRYLRYGLSYRDVEELLAERGIEADHVTVYRWVQRFTPLFADAARPLRHACGDRWFVDETYVKVAGRWRYLYRAVDQYGQVIDVLLSEQRDTAAARRFFTRALRHRRAPVEVTTDKAGPYLRVLDDLVSAAAHVTEQFANNRVEADHGRLKAGCARCADSNSCAPPRALPPAMRSCRTSAADTTNSPPTSHRRSVWRPHSASSRWRCDLCVSRPDACPAAPGRNRPAGGLCRPYPRAARALFARIGRDGLTEGRVLVRLGATDQNEQLPRGPGRL
jgi:IS6 family transposase